MRRFIFHRNTIFRRVIIEVNWSPQISAHKEDGVLFSMLFLCASRKRHRQTVSASAVNWLHQKRKKRTLAETLPWGSNPRPLGLESSTLPLNYYASFLPLPDPQIHKGRDTHIREKCHLQYFWHFSFISMFENSNPLFWINRSRTK